MMEKGYLFRYGDRSDGKFLARVWHLEQALASYLGVKHALAVNSGTSALMAGLVALGIGPGDEALVPGYTLIGSFSAVVFSRAIPILCEIDESLTIDSEDAARKISSFFLSFFPIRRKP
ncbi:MAG: DegT/DnrJ/EryC1/StrS family aminotransferase, partial [Candidatus Omnitrophica bacterium]|nr:DegT/DnrJ/EryC1/StrS family aminotransferase [Candidatus Omnitrophota bacterium]